MKDLKLRAYAPIDNKLKLVWEMILDGELREKGEVWFMQALKADFDEMDFIQSTIRESFIEVTGKDGIEQGDLLCIGTKQCYIIN